MKTLKNWVFAHIYIITSNIYSDSDKLISICLLQAGGFMPYKKSKSTYDVENFAIFNFFEYTVNMKNSEGKLAKHAYPQHPEDPCLFLFYYLVVPGLNGLQWLYKGRLLAAKSDM